MSERFVNVPAEEMFRFLEGRGFVRTMHRSRREVVYERAHDRDPRYKVLVYTSIAAGRATARAKGADAIRVVAIYEEPAVFDGRPAQTRGVAKLPKVLRTAPAGDPAARVHHVLERVLGRMREAYAVCNRRIAWR